MEKEIHCQCGYVIRASDDASLVSRAQEHAKQAHDMELTEEQALAMARPS